VRQRGIAASGYLGVKLVVLVILVLDLEGFLRINMFFRLLGHGIQSRVSSEGIHRWVQLSEGVHRWTD
jgi:hypothetical protein